MAIWLYAKYYPNRHSSLRHTINSAQIEKLRDRRSSLEEVTTTIHIYNPPHTPPFEKEGLVVILSAYLTKGEYYTNRHSSLRRTIDSAQIEKLRDRRSSLKEADAYYSVYMGVYH